MDKEIRSLIEICKSKDGIKVYLDLERVTYDELAQIHIMLDVVKSDITDAYKEMSKELAQSDKYLNKTINNIDEEEETQ